MLHTFVPHNHHDTDQSQLQESHYPENFIDFLAHAFHHSHADGQLENYSNERIEYSNQDVNSVALVPSDFNLALHVQAPTQFKLHELLSFIPEVYSDSYSYRGPPVI